MIPLKGQSNWILYSLYGALAVILSWFGTGCRFGSQTVSQPIPSDLFSGYYLTQPKSFKLLLTSQSTQTVQEKEVNVSLIPPIISGLMTNPVFFGYTDPSQGYSVIASATGKSSLPVIFNPQDLSLSLSGKTKPITAWLYPECSTFQKVTEAGQLRAPSLNSVPEGNTHAISGDMLLRLTIGNSFTGDCTQSFLEMSDCYLDENLCGGTSDQNKILHDYVAKWFDPYVQSGMITGADIPDVVSFGFEINYD